MAYRVNVYFNSEYIASTRIRSGSFIDETRYYGDDAYIADGFTNSTTFTATPASGCECTGWYYRIGGDSGTLTYDKGTNNANGTNSFTYSGTEEIIIRAVGQPISGGGDSGGDDGEDDYWGLSYGSFSSMVGTQTKEITIRPYTLYRYQVIFKASALVNIYTTGSFDTVGFLTTSPEPNLEYSYGCPSDFISDNHVAYDDDSGTDYNFKMSTTVTAGQIYYIWVRGAYGNESGTTTLKVQQTWVLSSGYNISVPSADGEKTRNLTLAPLRAFLIRCTFDTAGTATFYTTGSGFKTVGYYSKSNTSSFDFNNGVPTDATVSSNSTGLNFSMTAEVTADNANYIYVCFSDANMTGTVTLHIIPPNSTPTQWTWSDATYNAFLNKGNTKDVPYTEWNEFVNFVAKKTGYPTNAALMDASDTKLYATKFNTVRNAIGSVNTFMNGTNSIKEHHEATGQWDMSSGEVVKGQYFIDLTEYLNDIT